MAAAAGGNPAATGILLAVGANWTSDPDTDLAEVNARHRASFAIDPYNRLEETDENDNTATLTMDGYAVPVFNVTFVPILLSGDPPDIDTDVYMAVIGDLVPIGEHRAQVGRPLDLSDRNLGSFDRQLSVQTAPDELLHRWNVEARDFPYPDGGIGPRRGWVASRYEFAIPADD